MQTITHVTGTVVPLLLDDIDTDRIIPARFLRCVTFDGLGEHAFEDDRKQDSKHPFDDARFQGGSVLVGGRNFGCGSSREHAPQALIRWGISAIIAESFAEIFYGNSTTLAMPCVMASPADIVAIRDAVEADPNTEVTIDVQALRVRTSGGLDIPVTMPDSAREALLSGRWDPIQELLDNESAIEKKARELHYV